MASAGVVYQLRRTVVTYPAIGPRAMEVQELQVMQKAITEEEVARQSLRELVVAFPLVTVRREARERGLH